MFRTGTDKFYMLFRNYVFLTEVAHNCSSYTPVRVCCADIVGASPGAPHIAWN